MDVGSKRAVGRMSHARGRDDDLRHAEIGAIRCAMGRPCAAVCIEDEVPGIVTAADRDFAQGVGHVGVNNIANSRGDRLHVEHKRLGDLLADRFDRGSPICRHAAAEKVVWRDDAQHDVRVGHRDELAAATVTDGPGTRSGAVGTDPQQTILNARNRAAAGPKWRGCRSLACSNDSRRPPAWPRRRVGRRR